MWISSSYQDKGFDKFFLTLFGHDNLANYYKTNFSLVQFHKYSLSEIENMLPWERSIYIDLLSDYIRNENEKARDREAMLAAQRRKLR